MIKLFTNLRSLCLDPSVINGDGDDGDGWNGPFIDGFGVIDNVLDTEIEGDDGIEFLFPAAKDDDKIGISVNGIVKELTAYLLHSPSSSNKLPTFLFVFSIINFCESNSNN